MGSSSKKKKEKQKDFQKPKLKVGKAKPKADNFTDTSFKAKCESTFPRFSAVDCFSLRHFGTHKVRVGRRRLQFAKRDGILRKSGHRHAGSGSIETLSKDYQQLSQHLTDFMQRLLSRSSPFTRLRKA